MSDRFIRSEALIGKDALARLKNSRVSVFGLGGVGSYSAEALARSGVGTLYIYDNDAVSVSNINRQLIALGSTVGRPKTEVEAERLKGINPDIRIIENPIFVTRDTELPFSEFDFIIDAVDNVTAKLHIIEGALKNNVPVISVMGTGNKLDPAKLQISDIYKTHDCPLARVMRRELKKRGIEKLSVVWSSEPPITVGAEDESGRVSPASMVFVPAAAGMLAASYAIRKLTERE